MSMKRSTIEEVQSQMVASKIPLCIVQDTKGQLHQLVYMIPQHLYDEYVLSAKNGQKPTLRQHHETISRKSTDVEKQNDRTNSKLQNESKNDSLTNKGSSNKKQRKTTIEKTSQKYAVKKANSVAEVEAIDLCPSPTLPDLEPFDTQEYSASLQQQSSNEANTKKRTQQQKLPSIGSVLKRKTPPVTHDDEVQPSKKPISAVDSPKAKHHSDSYETTTLIDPQREIKRNLSTDTATSSDDHEHLWTTFWDELSSSSPDSNFSMESSNFSIESSNFSIDPFGDYLSRPSVSQEDEAWHDCLLSKNTTHNVKSTGSGYIADDNPDIFNGILGSSGNDCFDSGDYDLLQHIFM